MKENILIIDDEETTRNSLCDYLSLVGFNTFNAESAEKGLEKIQNQDFSVVITDISLPGMDGMEFTKLVTEKYNLDVIVMTGYSMNHTYVDAIEKGAKDFVSKPVHFSELGLRLKRVISERRLIQERDRMISKLQKLAITDSLTQLYNSRHFYEQLAIEVRRTRRYKHPLSLLLIDVDRFKQFNDSYGHLKGDEALSRIAKIIKSCLRGMDTAFRYGGEEFTVILPETDIEKAENVARRINQAVPKEKFMPESKTHVNLTVSIGLTQYQLEEDLHSFVQRADQAMYKSKRQGRNQVSLFTREDAE